MKNLTVINIIFLPLNLIAGILGMSEFTYMLGNHSKIIGFGVFIVFMLILGWITYKFLMKLEHRKNK